MKTLAVKYIILICCLAAIATGKKKRRSQDTADFTKDFKILSKAARILVANAQDDNSNESNSVSHTKQNETSKKTKGTNKKPFHYIKQNNLKGDVNQKTIEDQLELLRLKGIQNSKVHTPKVHDNLGAKRVPPKTQTNYVRSSIQHPPGVPKKPPNMGLRIHSGYPGTVQSAMQRLANRQMGTTNSHSQPMNKNYYSNNQYHTGNPQYYTGMPQRTFKSLYTNPYPQYPQYQRNNIGTLTGTRRGLRYHWQQSNSLVSAAKLPNGWYLPAAQSEIKYGYPARHYRDWSNKGNLAKENVADASRRQFQTAQQVYMKNTRFVNPFPGYNTNGKYNGVRRKLIQLPSPIYKQINSRNFISKAPFLGGVTPHYSKHMPNLKLPLGNMQRFNSPNGMIPNSMSIIQNFPNGKLSNAVNVLHKGGKLQLTNTVPPVLHIKPTTMSKSEEMVQSLKKGGLYILGGNEVGRNLQKMLIGDKPSENQVKTTQATTQQKVIPTQQVITSSAASPVAQKRQNVFTSKKSDAKSRLEKLQHDLDLLNQKRSVNPTAATSSSPSDRSSFINSDSLFSSLSEGMLFPPFAKSNIPASNGRNSKLRQSNVAKIELDKPNASNTEVKKGNQLQAISKDNRMNTKSNVPHTTVSTSDDVSDSAVNVQIRDVTNFQQQSQNYQATTSLPSTNQNISTTSFPIPSPYRTQSGFQPSPTVSSYERQTTVKRSPRYKWYETEPEYSENNKFHWNYFRQPSFYSPNEDSDDLMDGIPLEESTSQPPTQPATQKQQDVPTTQFPAYNSQPQQELSSTSAAQQQQQRVATTQSPAYNAHPQQESSSTSTAQQQQQQQQNIVTSTQNSAYNSLPQQQTARVTTTDQQPSTQATQQQQQVQQQAQQQTAPAGQQPTPTTTAAQQAPSQRTATGTSQQQLQQQAVSVSTTTTTPVSRQTTPAPQNDDSGVINLTNLPKPTSSIDNRSQQYGNYNYSTYEKLYRQSYQNAYAQQHQSQQQPYQQQQQQTEQQQPQQQQQTEQQQTQEQQLQQQNQQQQIQQQPYQQPETQQQQTQEQQPQNPQQPIQQQPYQQQQTQQQNPQQTVQQTQTQSFQPTQYQQQQQPTQQPQQQQPQPGQYQQQPQPTQYQQQPSAQQPQQQQQTTQQSQQQQVSQSEQHQQQPATLQQTPQPPTQPIQQQQTQQQPQQQSYQQQQQTRQQQPQTFQQQTSQQTQTQQQQPQTQQQQQQTQQQQGQTSQQKPDQPTTKPSPNIDTSPISYDLSKIRLNMLNASNDPVLKKFLDSPENPTASTVAVDSHQTSSYQQPIGIHVGSNGDPLLNSLFNDQNPLSGTNALMTPKPSYYQPTTNIYSNPVAPTTASSYQNSSFLQPYNDPVSNYANPTPAVSLQGHTSYNVNDLPAATAVPDGVTMPKGVNPVQGINIVGGASANPVDGTANLQHLSDGTDLLAFLSSQNNPTNYHPTSPLLSKKPIYDKYIQTDYVPIGKRSSFPIVLNKRYPYLSHDSYSPWGRRSNVQMSKKRRRVLEVKGLKRKRRNSPSSKHRRTRKRRKRHVHHLHLKKLLLQLIH